LIKIFKLTNRTSQLETFGKFVTMCYQGRAAELAASFHIDESGPSECTMS